MNDRVFRSIQITMSWVFWMFYLMWDSVFSSSLCMSFQGVTCCAGTYWNKEKSTCEKCPLGYYGSNCSEACDFPHFGKECQGKCNCSSHLCDHVTGCFEQINPSSKSIPVSYDITLNHMKSTSSRSEGSSLIKTLPNSIIYSVIICVIAFVVFFGLFSGTYFYRHCIKQSSVYDGKQPEKLSNQQEQYNILLQSSHIERENNSDTAYIEPISNVYYEEIETNPETVN